MSGVEFFQSVTLMHYATVCHLSIKYTVLMVEKITVIQICTYLS